MANFKGVNQNNLFALGIKERKGLNNELDQINSLIHWYCIEKVLNKMYSNDTGRPAYPPLAMFKILLLQTWFVLSDVAAEKFISDRISFRRFVGISLDCEIPDYSTISLFRNRLIENNLIQKLLELVNQELDKLGISINSKTLVDSTFVKANAHKPPRDKKARKPGVSKVDKDARFGKKGFGYQAHTSLDHNTHLIKKSVLKPANINDEKMLGDVVTANDKAVYADKVYGNKENRALLKELGVKDRLMRHGCRRKKLTEREELRNNLISPTRSKIEKIFGTMKRSYGFTRVRYNDLASNQLQLTCVCICCNLRRALKIVDGGGGRLVCT